MPPSGSIKIPNAVWIQTEDSGYVSTPTSIRPTYSKEILIQIFGLIPNSYVEVVDGHWAPAEGEV